MGDREPDGRAQNPTVPDGGALVVVANRLPVDEVDHRRAGGEWRRSPGGLVTALHPILAEHRGTWVGWAGAAGPAPDPFELDGIRLHPVPLSADEDLERLLRGPVQRHDLAALPRRGRDPGLPPALAGGLPRGQPPLRRGHRRGRRRRARPSGCRTTSSSSCRRCCASAGPTCASASSCTSRSRRSSCSCSCRSATEIIRGLLGADLVGFQSPLARAELPAPGPPPARAAPARAQSIDVDGRPVRAGAFPISIDVDEMERMARRPGRCRPGPSEIRAELGRPEDADPRRRPARLHQGHRAAPARRTASCSPRAG